MGDEFDLENFQKELDEDRASMESVCPSCGGDIRKHSQTQLSKCTSEAEASGPEDVVKKFEKSSYYTCDNIPSIQVATLKILLEIRDLLKKSKN